MGTAARSNMLRFGQALRGPLSRRADSVLLGIRSLPQTPQLHASCLPRRLMSTSPPEPSSDDSIELFRIENRHPMITYMPYIAVFQLGCWGAYAQTCWLMQCWLMRCWLMQCWLMQCWLMQCWLMQCW